MFAAFGASLAVALPRTPVRDIQEWLPVGLLSVFLFWQLIPLFTLSSGWSLQLNKLQIYPVSNRALFGIEVLLRLSTAPEMILVLAGTMIGLLRHPEIPGFAPFFLLLYIPFNMFLSLAVRELLLHSFERNRFRELFAILLISIAVLPQILLRTEGGRRVQPYLLSASKGRGTPWHEVAVLSAAPLFVARLSHHLLLDCQRLRNCQMAVPEEALSKTEGFRNNAPLLAKSGTPANETVFLSPVLNLPGSCVSRSHCCPSGEGVPISVAHAAVQSHVRHGLSSSAFLFFFQ